MNMRFSPREFCSKLCGKPLYIFLGMIALALGACSGSQLNNPGSGPQIGLELVADGLTAPLVLTSPRDGTGRLFVADQVGSIWIVSPDGGRLHEPFLDLSDRMVNLNPAYDERGLLGLAFHPQYQENGRFFVYYSAPLRAEAPGDWNHTSHLSEFHVSSGDPNRADAESERILLHIDQPQSNHNGGQISFGPDGYLYVPLGDGGGANDTGTGHPPQGNGQDRSTLLGSILRLDVNGDEPYAIPADNPFVGQGGREEIFAFGLRNPFRISFDAAGDQELFTGDVGQNLFEEVDIVASGGNYGWNIREGGHCFDPEQPGTPPDECPDTGPEGEALREPILEYGHEIGLAVIGGYVYRGSELPDLQGHYIFGDWSTSFAGGNGKILDGIPPSSLEGSWTFEPFEIASTEDGQVGDFVLSFGQDAEHELYVLTSNWPGPVQSSGRILRLVAAP